MQIFVTASAIVFLVFCAINLAVAAWAGRKAMKWAIGLSLAAPTLLVLAFFTAGAIKGGFAWSFGDPKFPLFLIQIGIPFGIVAGIATWIAQVIVWGWRRRRHPG